MVSCQWSANASVLRLPASDAALVGGTPHKRYFAGLGIPEDKIFTGYDAIDNAYFAARADEIRASAK